MSTSNTALQNVAVGTSNGTCAAASGDVCNGTGTCVNDCYIGGTLFAAFQRFDYDYVCAILISIIALIMAGELLAMGVRAIFIDGLSLADLFRGRMGRLAARGERHLDDD